MTENGENTHVRARITLSFLALVLIFVVVLTGFAWVIIDVREVSHDNKVLLQENSKRITEIQHSRLESCRGTYIGIRQVFLPFFPAKPRTRDQQDQLDKFNRTIDRLRKNCTEQIKVKADTP